VGVDGKADGHDQASQQKKKSKIDGMILRIKK
jgi:hypothetical protein